MPTIDPNPQRYEAAAELKLRDQERVRAANRYPERKRTISRRAYVLLQLAIVLIMLVGIIVMYHFLY